MSSGQKLCRLQLGTKMWDGELGCVKVVCIHVMKAYMGVEV